MLKEIDVIKNKIAGLCRNAGQLSISAIFSKLLIE